MSTPPGKKRKIHHVLKPPHEAPKLPTLASEDEQIILEMLCSLLEPIGTYRSQHIRPSKGKREKKRQKRALKKLQVVNPDTNVKVPLPPETPPPPPPPPPPPDISESVLIGFNTLNRHLSALAACSPPTDRNVQTSEPSKEALPAPGPVAAIFYPKRDVASLLTNHLPHLSKLASRSQPDHSPIRLIPLSTVHASDMLSKALHLPRVSFVGILADGSSSISALIKLCREKTEPVHLPWLDHVKQVQYENVKVKKIETFENFGKKRSERGRRTPSQMENNSCR